MFPTERQTKRPRQRGQSDADALHVRQGDVRQGSFHRFEGLYEMLANAEIAGRYLVPHHREDLPYESLVDLIATELAVVRARERHDEVRP